MWELKPDKRIQEKLFSGSETINDFMNNDWGSGLPQIQPYVELFAFSGLDLEKHVKIFFRCDVP